jgi:hypothetical protein
MIGEQRRIVRMALGLGDLAAVAAAFFAAYYLRARVLAPVRGPIYPLDVHLPVLLIALPIWVLAFHFTGLYRAPTPRVGLRETGAVVRALFPPRPASPRCLQAHLTSRIVIALFVALSAPAVMARTAAEVSSEQAQPPPVAVTSLDRVSDRRPVVKPIGAWDSTW